MHPRTLAITSFTALALSTAALVALAQTTKPADASRDRRDTNRDGVVSTQEKAGAREKQEARFKAADTNKDGGLSREELKNTRNFGNIERYFDAMDTNKDGKVTLEERNAYMKVNRKATKAPSGSTGSGGGGLLPPR